MEKLTANELNLLLYLETCLVDATGMVDQMKLNDEDRKIMGKWNASGFVLSGRLRYAEIDSLYIKNVPGRRQITHWVRFTDSAWAAAHQERLDRANRCLKKRYEGEDPYLIPERLESISKKEV